MLKVIITTLAVCTSLLSAGWCAKLGKPEASQILNNMGCNNNNIVSVLHSAGYIGLLSIHSPDSAIVFVTCQRKEGVETRRYSFFHDDEIGWHFIEESTEYWRVWTKSGYQEFRISTPKSE